MMTKLENLVNETAFVDFYFPYEDEVRIFVSDFAGFDEDWDEIYNDVDFDAVREIERLAEILNIEVEFSSYDI